MELPGLKRKVLELELSEHFEHDEKFEVFVIQLRTYQIEESEFENQDFCCTNFHAQFAIVIQITI